MELPFSHGEFLEVFASYNRSFAWAAAILWVVTLAIAVRWLRDPASASRSVLWLLVLHWAWSGAVYHLGFFRAINPAALLFGLLFLLQAVLFGVLSLGRPRLDFASSLGFWRYLGGALVAYGLAYPAVGLAFGMTYPSMPTFGVPCPTVILTVGFLLGANLTAAKWIAVIPLIWTVIGGSAAFVLGIQADLILPLAGLALLSRLGVMWGKR